MFSKIDILFIVLVVVLMSIISRADVQMTFA